MAEAKPLLAVEDLVVEFPAGRGKVVHAVSGVSFSLREGETLGLVGESGCGKSTVARAVMQLVEPKSGSVQLRDTELVGLTRGELAEARAEMQMVFQDPLSSLNPRRRVKDIVSEGLRIRGLNLDEAETESRVRAALAHVELDYDVVADRRAHEFSGGQCQRICIARALALAPSMLVCDEIVSSLDVSVQAQLLNVLADMKAELGLALLFIAHDLAVVEHVSDRVMVMYLGKACEVGPVEAVFEQAAHPYTRLLLASIPSADLDDGLDLPDVPGEVPSPISPPSGCRFRTRCPRAEARCATDEPLPTRISDDHFVACHFPHTEPLVRATPPTTYP